MMNDDKYLSSFVAMLKPFPLPVTYRVIVPLRERPTKVAPLSPLLLTRPKSQFRFPSCRVFASASAYIPHERRNTLLAVRGTVSDVNIRSDEAIFHIDGFSPFGACVCVFRLRCPVPMLCSDALFLASSEAYIGMHISTWTNPTKPLSLPY